LAFVDSETRPQDNYNLFRTEHANLTVTIDARAWVSVAAAAKARHLHIVFSVVCGFWHLLAQMTNIHDS
jgi:hypothetical protein